MQCRIGMVATFLLLGLFLGIAFTVQVGSGFGAVDQQSSLLLQDLRTQSVVMRGIFLFFTDLGSARVLTLVGISMAVVFLLLRKPGLSCTWSVMLIVGFLGYGLLKDLYARPRPLVHDAAIVESNFSFPSGHSFESLVAYGFLAYLLLPLFHRRASRLLLLGGAALVVLAIGFSRIFLGAHYLSDVVGGYAAGGCWLMMCVTARERIRELRAKRVLQPEILAALPAASEEQLVGIGEV
jgi:membrane-associated phospholipid phosphatase